MNLTPKYQEGGNFLPYFPDYMSYRRQEIAPSSQAPQRAQTREKDSTKGKITSKDLAEIMKEDGLPNDMESIMGMIQNSYNSLGSLGSGYGDFEDYTIEYAQIMSAASLAKHSKEIWKKTHDQLQSKNALNSIAVTRNKQVIVYNQEGQLQNVSIKDYLDNQDNYVAVTYGNLMKDRAENPNFTFQNGLFEMVQNGTSIDQVKKDIKEAVGKLGTSEVSLTGYTTKQKENIAGGIEVLDELSRKGMLANMPLDGLYKTKAITKEQKEQADAAVLYIYKTLSPEAQGLLELQGGNSENPTEGAVNLIQTYITATQSTTKSLEADFQDNLNMDGTTKSKSGKGSGKDLMDEPTNMPEMFLSGLGSKDNFEINPGTKSSTVVYANTLPLTNNKNDSLGLYCSLKEVSEGNYQGIFDWNKATMAGRKVNMSSSDNILVTDGNVSSVDFPVDINGNPDLSPETTRRKQEADSLLASKGIDLKDPQSIKENLEEINNIYQQAGLAAAYDSTGELRQGWRRFAVMNCVTDDRSLGIDTWEDSVLYREITEDSEINEIVRNIQAKNKDYDYSRGIFSSDTLIESTLWIPVKENYQNASLGNMRSIRQSEEIEKMQLMLDRRNQLLQQYNHKENP